MEVKIADFGLSRSMEGEEFTPMVGHKDHMAPEMIHQEYTVAVDIWSLGMLACHVLRLAHGLDIQKKDFTEEQARYGSFFFLKLFIPQANFWDP
jgi:serine/threonine protein kinase